MRRSRLTLLGFFGAIVLVATVLYPRAFFLGYIYEGRAELERAEQAYLRGLADRPTAKPLLLRLINLYERMGRPEQAALLWERLAAHRATDWRIATQYLDFLERQSDPEAVYRAQVRVARNFMAIKRFRRERVEALLYDAYRYARWTQRRDEAYALLADLERVARDPQPYREAREGMDRGRQDRAAVRAALERQVVDTPDDVGSRLELVSVLRDGAALDAARRVLDEGLRRAVGSAPLLRASATLAIAQGDLSRAVTDLEQWVQQSGAGMAERRDVWRELASLYRRQGTAASAEAVYRTLLAQDPRDQPVWQDWIALWLDAAQPRRAVVALQEYLQHFPDDHERQRLLVDLLLYELHDAAPLPLYWRYVATHHDRRRALDVAHLLMSRRADTRAAAWLAQIAGLWPRWPEIVELRIEALRRAGRNAEAVRIGRVFLQQAPAHGGVRRAVAALAVEHGDFSSAVQDYVALARSHRADAAVQQEAAEQLLALGEPETARQLLVAATAQAPAHAALWFWRSEAEAAVAQMKAARASAAQLLSVAGSALPRDPLVAQQWLKAKVRLADVGAKRLPRALWADYEAALVRFPQHADLVIDAIDLLLADRQYAAARQQLDGFAQHFPLLRAQREWLETRWWIATAQWDRAVPRLEALLAKPSAIPLLPSARSALQRDLAEVYGRSRRWRQAVPLWEQVGAATGNRLGAADALWALHAEHDARLRAVSHVTRYGSDTIVAEELGYRQEIGARWAIAADAELGHLQSDGGAWRTAGIARIHGVTDIGAMWRVGVGLGGGSSTARQVVTPSLMLRFAPSDRLQLSLAGEYHGLRIDLPSAVQAGTAQDRGELQWEYRPWRRVVLSGRYEYRHLHANSDGAAADEHHFEPAVAMIVTERPLFSVGYQFGLTQVEDRGNFLAQVPLIARSRAHYLTAQLAHRLRNHALLEAGIFLGEDPSRGLHLLQGELFGVRTRAEVPLSSWLDFAFGYQYGQETRTQLAGRSHDVQVGFSGHWQ
ncbi:MAG: hypothetical protein HY696_02100 [Deltaproteobacteria bacterium]|nr:hypothetical protein [Deltaproteobacteria bacterium]